MEYLIPDHWFVDLHWSNLLVTTAISIVILGKGAGWLVESASGVAYRFGIPKIIVGATIVSLGTTAPECAVSVMAAIGGASGLALGNAVGSVIADSGLIFGIGCLMTVLPADRFVLNRQGWVQFGSGCIFSLVCYVLYMLHGPEAEIGRLIGVTALVVLAAYLFQSVKWARQHTPAGTSVSPAETENAAPGGAEHETTNGRSLLVLFSAGITGLLLVLIGARILIASVQVLAERLGVPQVVVASTIVAFGTSLPELVVGITAILKKHAELLVGNVIGADILNILFVIGASATSVSLPLVDQKSSVPTIFLVLHLPAMLVILVLFRIFIFSACKRGHFQKWFGIPLLAVYVGFVALGFILGKS